MIEEMRMHKGRMAVALALIALPAAALAHHGWSSYNTDKTTRLAGPFTSVSWSNPHGTATMNWQRSEEHTSELQSLMRNSYAVFCLKKKKEHHQNTQANQQL